MSLLGNGDSLYLGPNWRVTSSRSATEASCIYDFPVVSFALNGTGDKIAFLVKDDIALGDDSGKKIRRRSGATKTPTHIIKIFDFDRSEIEVGSLSCTLPTGPARRIQWSPSGKFVFLFDTPSSHITILSFVAGELKVLCEDTALAPFFYHYGPAPEDEWCALINEKRQTADCWDLKKNNVAASLQLSRRSIRLVDTAVAGRVVVSLYDNLCISFAVWDEPTAAFIKYPKIDDLFKDRAHSEEELSRKISHKLRVSATDSESEILVGLTTCKDIYRFEIKASKATMVGVTTIVDGAALVDVAGTPPTALVEFERYNFQIVELAFAERNVQIESKSKKDKKKRIDDGNENRPSEEVQSDHEASAPVAAPPAPVPTKATTAAPPPIMKFSLCVGVGILLLLGLKKISRRT